MRAMSQLSNGDRIHLVDLCFEARVLFFELPQPSDVHAAQFVRPPDVHSVQQLEPRPTKIL